jgi:arginase
MKLTVIGVPSAWGAPESGVIDTPARLRAAGLLEWLAGADLEVRDHGDVPVPAGWQPPVPLEAHNTEDGQLPHQSELLAVQREVRQAAAGAIEAGELPLLIGGECSIAPGAVAAVAAATSGDPLGDNPARTLIVWLDAHGDLNTAETSPSGLLCGMPLSVTLGRGHPAALAVGADAPTTRPEDTWLIGARDLDAGELATLAELPINHVTVDELRGLGAEQLIERILPGAAILPPEARALASPVSVQDSSKSARAAEAAVYLHIDVDCIDPREVPGVTFPVADGLGTAEVADLAGYLCASGQLAALTIASANLVVDESGRTVESLRRLLTSMADALALAE